VKTGVWIGRQELADERCRGPFDDVVGRAVLFDAAVIHHRNAVGQLERFVLVVRDEHAREMDVIVEAPQPCGVKRLELFVQ
jgi:hypothetical protein